MGANVELENERDVAGEPVADLVARSSQLHGTTVDGDLVPLAIDEISLVALLGLFAEGETVVADAAELRAKESDRLAVVARRAVQRWAATSQRTADGWRIRRHAACAGTPTARATTAWPCCSRWPAALGDGAEIAGADSVAISYPSFWSDLAR